MTSTTYLQQPRHSHKYKLNGKSDDMEAKKPPNVFCMLPGQTTGDLWHLGAAGLLSKEYGKNGKAKKSLALWMNFVTVIGVAVGQAPIDQGRTTTSDLDEAKLYKDQRENGKATFEFLRNLGLDVIVVGINTVDPKTKGNLYMSGIQVMQAYMLSMISGYYDKILAIQTRYKNDLMAAKKGPLQFDDLVQKLSSLECVLNTTGAARAGAGFNANMSSDRVCGFMTATTLAMMALEDIPTRPARMTFLQENMGRYHKDITDAMAASNTPIPDVNDLAKTKLNQLKELCAGPIKEGNLIVIYNNRSSQYNKQTDSTATTFDNFKKSFEAFRSDRKVFFVIINTGGPELKDQVVFDLFDKNKLPKDSWKYPGIDPLVTCKFWSLVALDVAESGGKTFFGMFSGRSGSLDCAAFNGVKCYFWDEPWLEVAMKDPATLKSYSVFKVPGGLSDKEGGNLVWKDGIASGALLPRLAKGTDQVPQCLRCLQLTAICFVGIPQNKANYDEDWGLMRDQPFLEWAKDATTSLTANYYPALPDFSKKGLYSAENWLYWSDSGRASQIRFFRTKFEAPNWNNPEWGWYIYCSLLKRVMGVPDE